MPAGRQALAAAALRRTGLGAALGRLPLWHGVLILCYHRIGDASESGLNPHLFSARAEEFDAQMRFLARSADVIGLDDLDAALDRRGRSVLVTFDDGYRDNHAVALPILREHGVPAAFFLATAFFDERRLPWWDELAHLAGGDLDRLETATARYKSLPAAEADAAIDELAAEVGAARPGPAAADGLWMTWDMARELRDAGHAVGGHTVNHPVLARLPVADQEREVVGGLDRLEAELGERPRWFSYPVGGPGDFDGDTAEVVRGAGLRGAFAFSGGHARPGAVDRFAIPRAAVGEFMDTTKLRAATVLPGLFARW